LHTWDGGKTFNTGGLGVEDSEWLLSLIKHNALAAVETGAGLSTLIFLQADLNVTSYVNDEDLVTRMLNYLDLHPKESAWDYQIGLSGDLLSSNSKHHDIGLIDGGHGFPIPFVDFYFVNRGLSKGGILIIDDANLFAPRELINNLMELREQFKWISTSPSLKAYAFEKISDDTHLADFGGLPRDLRFMFNGESIFKDLYQLNLDYQNQYKL
jgi:predicted O-methyltransferase YrrM